MANVSASHAELEVAATRLEEGRTEIDGAFSRLQTLVQDLVGGGLVPEASYGELAAGVATTIERLDAMGERLEQAARVLREADEQLTAALHED